MIVGRWVEMAAAANGGAIRPSVGIAPRGCRARHQPSAWWTVSCTVWRPATCSGQVELCRTRPVNGNLASISLCHHQCSGRWVLTLLRTGCMSDYYQPRSGKTGRITRRGPADQHTAVCDSWGAGVHTGSAILEIIITPWQDVILELRASVSGSKHVAEFLSYLEEQWCSSWPFWPRPHKQDRAVYWCFQHFESTLLCCRWCHHSSRSWRKQNFQVISQRNAMELQWHKPFPNIILH